MKYLDPLLPLVLLLLHGFLYNEVGHLAAARGLDFGPALEIPLDRVIPFVPVFALPYSLVWLFPVALTVYLLAAGVDPRSFRALFGALLVLMLACYALWIAFPVKVGLRLDEEVVAAHGWLGELVLVNYRSASHWNACPSFHVAGPWFLYRTARTMAPGLPRVFFWLMLAIALATVFIRIHYVLDIAFGLMVGEAVVRLVFRPLHEAGSLARIPRRAAWGGSLAVLAAGGAGYALLSLG